MKRFVVALLAVTAMAAAHAGRDCTPHAPQAANVVRSLDLAERTRQALEASGAQVVLLARAGQDLSRWGLAWSHVGWAYRGEGGWRVVHKLNACGNAEASIYRQGLGEFFLDDPFDYRAGYAVPVPALQAQLLPLLQDNGRAARLHQRDYSMVAYPWAQRYQQSNQWAIETLALAARPALQTRAQAQAWLQLEGYVPGLLQVDAFTRLGARVGSPNIAFDDHPDGERYAGRIRTVTADSVFAWLARSGMAGSLNVVR